MKRTNIYTLATLALLLGFAACTQEDSMTDPGTTLFDGPYPLQIGTVTVSSEVSGVQTRVTETTDGTGSVFESGDEITVQLGDETVTYTFNGTAWTTDTQLYWTTAGQTLTAWYTSPDYTDTQESTVDLSDQSNGLVYVLRATADFAQTVNLDFTHRLAKVRVVTTGSYDTSDSVLKLTAPTELTVSQGEITETGSEGRITMYKTGYNDIDNDDIDNGDITCWEATVPDNTTISSVTIDGTTCTLNDGGITTAAGKLHTITLNVAEDPGYTYDQEANTYKVYAANGLLAWNQAVQNDLTLNCTLAADIDLRGIEYTWLLVGNDIRRSNHYTGTFDGGDHTITGLTVNYGNSYYVGLIGYLGSGGKVQNLTLDNVSITGNNYVGIVGYNTGTVTSCSVSGSVDGTDYVGGVVGYNDRGSVTNCSVSGSIDDSVSGDEYVGGIVGYNYSGTVTDCTTSGTITGSGSYVGGVAGRNDGTVTDCTVPGSVTGSGDYVGGVVGINYGTVTACTTSSSVNGTTNVGGVAGYNYNAVTNCSVSGTVTGSGNYVGGVAGRNGGGTVTACTVPGAVTGSGNYVGGVAGYNSGTVTACSTSGSVTGYLSIDGRTNMSSYVGGVVGWNTSTVTACYSLSSVSAGSYIGGVVGWINGGTVTACYHASGGLSGDSTIGSAYVGGVAGVSSIIVTACYWSDYSGNGIGGNASASGVTKVDGESITWDTAVITMNSAISTSGWQYVYDGSTTYPTLTESSSQ